MSALQLPVGVEPPGGHFYPCDSSTASGGGACHAQLPLTGCVGGASSDTYARLGHNLQ